MSLYYGRLESPFNRYHAYVVDLPSMGRLTVMNVKLQRWQWVLPAMFQKQA